VHCLSSACSVSKTDTQSNLVQGVNSAQMDRMSEPCFSSMYSFARLDCTESRLHDQILLKRGNLFYSGTESPRVEASL
jgi:hypothetical protein